MSDFTDQYGPLARDIAGQTGLQPSVVLAIIDHETGGGQHIPNNNLFGMMDSKGQPRQYVDQGGSGVDFVNLMKGPRFAKAATFTDPVDQAQAISNLGYGPGPADAAAHPDQASGAAYANSLIAKAKGYHQAGFTNDPPMTVDQAMELTKPKAAAATPAPIEPGLVPSATQIPPPMSVDDAMERTGSPRNGGTDTAPPQPSPPTTGLWPNIAAGAAEGAAGLINVMHDPFGNLVGKPLLTLGGAAYDAAAPYLGYQRMTPEQRADLTGDSGYTQPGTGAVNALATKAGLPTPDQVVPGDTLDTIARKGTAGAVGGAAFGPLVAGSMAGGAIVGDRAALLAPDWAKPAVELGANILTSGGLVKLKGMGSRQHPYEYGTTAEERAAKYYPDGSPVVEPRGPEAPSSLSENAAALTPLAEKINAAPPQAGGFKVDMSRLAEAQRLLRELEEDDGPDSVGAAATPPDQRGTYPPDPKLEARIAEATRLAHEQTLLNQPASARVNGKGWDTTPYVEGSIPSKAEYTGDGGIAVRQRADMEHPDQAARWIGQEQQNNAARTAHFQNESGSAPTLLQQKLDLATKYAPKYDNLWLNEKSVDPGMANDISDHINSVIAGPDGKNAAVANALKAVESKLHVGNDASAPLETSPEQLFGARQEVTRLLGATARRADPNLGDPRVSYRLGEIKDQLDNTIESGAKGYKAVQEGYHTDSIPIDKQELLQGYAPDLYDSKGMMTLRGVQNMLEDIVTQRGMPGANQAKSLNNADMSKLFDLRNDLQRRANVDLGKARGSNTAQTFQTLRSFIPDAVAHGLSIPAHMAINQLVGDPILNYMALTAQTGLEGLRVARKAASDRAARVDDYLKPPPGWNVSPSVTPQVPGSTPAPNIPGINGWNRWNTGGTP